jgi:hypothetical protein
VLVCGGTALPASLARAVGALSSLASCWGLGGARTGAREAERWLPVAHAIARWTAPTRAEAEEEVPVGIMYCTHGGTQMHDRTTCVPRRNRSLWWGARIRKNLDPGF